MHNTFGYVVLLTSTDVLKSVTWPTEKSMINPTLSVFYLNCEIEAIYFKTVIVYFVLVLITALVANEDGKLSIIGMKRILEATCFRESKRLYKNVATPQHLQLLKKTANVHPFNVQRENKE